MNWIVLGLFLLLTCDVSAQDQNAEVIGGVVVVEDGVAVVVRSGGCTRKEDFEVVVNKIDDAPAEVLISRVRTDFCKRVPFLEEIRFSYGELGIGPDEAFRIVNPISTQAVNYL